MHAILLTLLVVTGADQPLEAPVDQAPSNQATEAVTQGECAQGCDECGAGAKVARRNPLCSWLCDLCGPMPQTCYSPHFGCYPGSSRTIHRYPAFHGYYYRQPYNYRHLFDYPWHATPHQPVGFFAYQQGMEDCPENAMRQGTNQAGAVQARHPSPRPPQKLQR